MTTPDDRSDQHEKQWLDRARQGDQAAFGQLVRKHHRRVYRLAVQLTGNAGDADDVTQETFLRAFRAIDRFDGRADLFTWLYRICVNVSLNLRRQRKRVTADIDDPRLPEPAAEGSDPAQSSEQAQSYRRLAEALDSLSESLRTTVVLACVEQIPYKDIAGILGCSEGTVAWRVHEARRRLREALPDAVLSGLEAPETAGGSRGR
ncbi:MAG: sigma-70 family RNA polymerase sigma factor [Myxococcales bacterium]|nr:sigma-70 family RNA polymerase sigma factor [Myxococcales bacterium]